MCLGTELIDELPTTKWYPTRDYFFERFYFEFQQVYSQWQEITDSNIKPVTVKELYSILYSSETSLQWAASHLTLLHTFLYI